MIYSPRSTSKSIQNKNLRIPNKIYLFVRHSFSGTLIVRKGNLMICKEKETNYTQNKCVSCNGAPLLPHDLNTKNINKIFQIKEISFKP